MQLRNLLAAVLLVSALAAPVTGCDRGEDPVARGGAERRALRETPPPRFARLVRLSPCPLRTLRPHYGGANVRVTGLTCEEVATLLPELGLPIGRNDPHAGAFERGNGWTCWAQYLQRPFGPVQNVCWRGEVILTYKVY